MKRVWIIAAFGDIRGYRKWCRNRSVTEEVRRPFMRKFFRRVDEFCAEWKCQVKRLGDGFIFFFEVPTRRRKTDDVFNILVGLKDLTERIVLELFHADHWPLPYGFRIRVPGGWVDRYMVPDFNNKGKKLPEYIGESPNLARELLYVRAGTPIIVHSNVIRRLTKEQREALGAVKMKMRGRVRGVDDEDIGQLWEVPLSSKASARVRRR